MIVRVLLIEDDEADAEYTKRQFRHMGPEFALDRASSLEEALTRLGPDRTYHLVLLDLGLPGTHGLSALRSVATLDANLPIIVLTGHDDDATALAALREGAQDYVVKGKSSADTIVRAVRYALERGRLQAERAALEKRLAHTQRLEALGRLAGGISHEINNRLTPIVGMAEWLLTSPPDGDKAKRMAETILAAAEQATALVRNLLTYARYQPDAAKTPVDLRETIAHSTTLIRATLPPSVRLTVQHAGPVSHVRGNPTQLVSVILNLLANAADAMERRTGVIALTLTEIEGHKVEVPANPPLIHPRYLRLTIEDDGIGMDRDTLARAFDPFFTSKTVDKGTGLGLSIVHGIVIDHQGAIAVSSTPGHGTKVEVFLPTAGE